ncbi:SIMPL domain-containing protein [Gilvimarinus agarilyticus]|uniref:SIMPL domain-containing protein n=1 Tax=Gilvimarinus agarilyticus TaxID=679259 RepID=UPI0005A1C8C1|nr:SIMPL domain-containing protein [Gilvimarinus agarilyticus]
MTLLQKLLSATAVLAVSVSTWAQPMPDFPFITVTGEAEIEVAPDTVTVNFQVMEFNKSAELAMNTVAERGAEVVALAKENGLSHEQIESYAIDKQVRRNRENMNGNMEIIGYEVTQRFTLEVDGLDTYEKLMNKLMRMDNTSGLNASFDISNRDEVMTSLVAKAGADARERGNNLAAALDAEIKSVYAITEDAGFDNFMARFGVSAEKFGAISMAADRGRSFDLFAPETITLSKRINVIFKINP